MECARWRKRPEVEIGYEREASEIKGEVGLARAPACNEETVARDCTTSD